MNKTISIIMPYIMIGFVCIMNMFEIPYLAVVKSFLCAIMIGFWFFHIHKTEGTSPVKNLILLTILFNIALFACEFVFIKNQFLLQIMPDTALCLGLLIVEYYIVSQNKPRVSMTYKYSFRNRRRRYF